MSYREEALAAFESMTRSEWGWFCPRGFSSNKREEFAALIRDGRVDARFVLVNIDMARRTEVAQKAVYVALGTRVDMPVRRKGTGMIADLRVVS